MISSPGYQQNKNFTSTNGINYSIVSGFIAFIVLVLFLPSLSLGLKLWLCFLVALVVFLFQDSQELVNREKRFYKGYYPPTYSYYRFFLAAFIILYFFVVILNNSDVISILGFIIIAILSSLVSTVPYVQSTFKNQNYEIRIQKMAINDLSRQISDQNKSMEEITRGKIPLEKSSELIKQQVDETETKLADKQVIDLKRSTEAEERWVREQLERVREMESLVEEKSVLPAGPVQSMPPPDERTVLEDTSAFQTQNAQSIIPRGQITDQVPAQRSKALIETIKENFSGYLFFGSIIFLFIAGLAWILLFFPTSAQVNIGVQTWIAGDTVVLVGILFILISEFILGKRKYSEHVPINYLGIGVGLGISIIGLLSIRFDVMPIFLTEFGFIDKNWLFFMLSFLVSALSWIYAWRSPYRDLIFGSLLSGFILVDYSLQFDFNLLVAIGLVSGFSFILLPGIHASLTESKDNRFLFGGFIVFNLILLKTEDLLALIKINDALYLAVLLIPAISFVILFVLKKISSLYLFLSLPLTAFPFLINELAFLNTYIPETTFYLGFIILPIVYLIPIILKRNEINYDIVVMSINVIFILVQSILVFFQILNYNSWFLILEPVLINSILVITEIYARRTKIEYILIIQSLSIVSLGFFMNQIGLVSALLGLSIIITILLINKEYTIWIKVSYLAASISVIVLGSFFGISGFGEIFLLPILIPIILIYLKITGSISKKIILPVVTIPMVATVGLTISRPIFANYLMMEYFIVILVVGLYLLISKQKDETDLIYWFALYLGFLGTTIYPEYNLILIYSLFILLTLETLLLLMRYISGYPSKRLKQYLYDSTNILIFGGLFSLIILEQYNSEIFLVTFFIFLVLNLILVLYLLRFSGLDFTFGMLMPALVLIGKELYVTQYLAKELDPFYSLLEFIFIAVFAFSLALLSRKVSDYEAWISPNITAMFSIELVLIVLFVNKIITGFYAFGTFFGLLAIIIVVNLLQKVDLRHMEYLVIVLSSIILAIVLPKPKIVVVDFIYILMVVDYRYIIALMISIAIFWFILRVKIQRLHFAIDIISMLSLVLGEYILSLELPNKIFIQSGLIIQQVIIVLVLLSFVLKLKSYYPRDRFKILLSIQVPFWLSLGIFYDLESQSNILYSQFTDNLPLNDLILLKVSLIVLFVILLLIYLLQKFEEKELTANMLLTGVIANMTLGLVLIQIIVSQILTDAIINGLILVALLFGIQLLAIISIRRKNQMQTSNQIVIISSFYLIMTIVVFLLSRGLSSGLIAILGTILVIIGFTENFRKEEIVIGVFYLLISITKIVFDIINNFNVLLLEIAISSSILAVCLLLLGMVVNYRLQRT